MGLASSAGTIMPKPILQTIHNNMGTILVIRSPRTRQWLFNLNISVPLETKLIAMKGYIMKTLLLSTILFCAFVLTACGQNPVAPTTHYHYSYQADTLYQSDFATDDTLQAHNDSTWTTAKVYVYQDSLKWLIGSLSWNNPGVDIPPSTNVKPVWWDGAAIDIVKERLPLYWTTIVIRYSRKEEVQ